mgnify:CR=1 FL=1
MLKSVAKEIFIILLLSLAIILILGILFYEYIPINKYVPEREAYVTPENVKNELEETITETGKVEVTYEVTDADLNIYQQTGTYTEGKANPFALENEIVNNTNGEANDPNENTNDNNGPTTDPNSTGTFFNEEGIK